MPPMAFATRPPTRATCARSAQRLGIERCGASRATSARWWSPSSGCAFPGFVERQCLFNTLAPPLVAGFAAAGIPEDPPRDRARGDGLLRAPGQRQEGLLAELDTPERRRAYVAPCTRERGWAAPGAFTRGGRRLSQQSRSRAPRRCARRSRSTRSGSGSGRSPSRPVLAQMNPIPTLILYGPEDRVVTRHFPARMAVAFPNHEGPFEIAGSGHFISWEQPEQLHAHAAEVLPRSALTTRRLRPRS